MHFIKLIYSPYIVQKENVKERKKAKIYKSGAPKLVRMHLTSISTCMNNSTCSLLVKNKYFLPINFWNALLKFYVSPKIEPRADHVINAGHAYVGPRARARSLLL